MEFLLKRNFAYLGRSYRLRKLSNCAFTTELTKIILVRLTVPMMHHWSRVRLFVPSVAILLVGLREVLDKSDFLTSIMDIAMGFYGGG